MYMNFSKVWSWRWTGKPGELQFIELQQVGHHWATEHTILYQMKQNQAASVKSLACLISWLHRDAKAWSRVNRKKELWSNNRDVLVFKSLLFYVWLNHPFSFLLYYSVANWVSACLPSMCLQLTRTGFYGTFWHDEVNISSSFYQQAASF